MTTLESNALRCGIPEYMLEGITRYLRDGIMPGYFLTAIFSNDLMGAYAHADFTNQMKIASYAQFIFNFCPMDSHGSREIMKAYCAKIRAQKEVKHD